MKLVTINILVALLSINLACGRETLPPYLVMARGYNIDGESHLFIPQGYVVEIVSLDLVTGTDIPGIPGQNHTFSFIQIDSGSPSENYFRINYTSESLPSSLPKFMGPASVLIQANGGVNSRAIAAFKFTQITENNFIPNNTVVIPTDATGTVNVILESSEDLVSWTAADPGTYGSTTSKRFFRVRAMANP